MYEEKGDIMDKEKEEMAKQAFAELEGFMTENVLVPAFLQMTKAAGIPEPRTPQELRFMLDTAMEIQAVKEAAQSGQYPELQQALGNDFEYVANMAKRASSELFGPAPIPVTEDMIQKVAGFTKAAAAAGIDLNEQATA